MRKWILLFVVITLVTISSAQGQGGGRYASEWVANCAGAAQSVVAELLSPDSLADALKAIHRDTVYVGYPREADPPQVFLDRLRTDQLLFMAYSQMPSTPPVNALILNIERGSTADTVLIGYHDRCRKLGRLRRWVPKSPSEPDYFIAKVALERPSGRWHVISTFRSVEE
jgi:hypothetical protein